MSDEVLVRVEGVSKKFCRSLKKSLWYGVQDVVAEAFPYLGGGKGKNEQGARLRPGEFWANKDVSFELRRGECLGLIGHNGAGKTTLLKMLNGLIKPDVGRIEMKGRVGALIALGAGFNPILTGRENIYVNGSVLGLNKKEIDEKIEEIVEFAEIGEFIDAPVQTYSSGMQVRLGFAIATSIEPEVLLLDEVLAVGDASFRAKCYNRVGKLKDRASVILVSHSMEAIAQFCSHGLCMGTENPRKQDTSVAISAYHGRRPKKIGGGDNSFLTAANGISGVVLSLPRREIEWGSDLEIVINFSCISQRIRSVRVELYDSNLLPLAEWFSARRSPLEIEVDGRVALKISVKRLVLKNGLYSISLLLYGDNSVAPLIWSYQQERFSVAGAAAGWHGCQLDGCVSNIG